MANAFNCYGFAAYPTYKDMQTQKYLTPSILWINFYTLPKNMNVFSRGPNNSSMIKPHLCKTT